VTRSIGTGQGKCESFLGDRIMEGEKKTLKVQVGEPFRITVWEDRTHGHSWQPRFDSAPIELLDEDYVRTIHVDTADSGRRTFQFLCSKPGEFEIVFEKRIGWKFTADNRKVFMIEASP
jgi:predicted secreted protein